MALESSTWAMRTKAPDHVTDRRALRSVGNSRVDVTAGMKPEEVRVVGDDDSTLCSRSFEEINVLGTASVSLRNRQHVDPALPQAYHDRLRDVLIHQVLDRARHSASRQLGGVLGAKLSDQVFALADRSVDLFPIVEVVGQGCVDVGQSQSELGGDLVRGLSELLVQDHDILNGDPVPGDPGLSAGDPRRGLNVLIECSSLHERGPVDSTSFLISGDA